VPLAIARLTLDAGQRARGAGIRHVTIFQGDRAAYGKDSFLNSAKFCMSVLASAFEPVLMRLDR
jgi:hypothetical protein